MNKRKLGKTGISLSELGFGCSGLWGKDILGKPAITDEQAFMVFKEAFDSGISFFDTGFNYGYAEKRLGLCIKELEKAGIKRSDIIIETKCGETLKEDGSYGPSDYSPEWIKRSIDISLQRLQLDYIDMLAIHGGSIGSYSSQLMTLLDDYKSQGIIRAYGVSGGVRTETIEWICKENNFDFVMLTYNIMTQDREDLIQRLHDIGIGVIAGGAMAQNLYSNNIYKISGLKDVWYLLRAVKKFHKELIIGKKFRFINNNVTATGNQIALRYVLNNPNITSALFQTTSLEHLQENIKATQIQLSNDLMNQIKNEGKRK